MSGNAEIAVFLGDNGQTARFYEVGKIVIFNQEKGGWKVSREKSFPKKEIQGMQDFRIKMENILEFLDQCHVFVGLEITGVAYYFLEKAECSIWECEGNPYDFLDHVNFQEELREKESYSKKCGKANQANNEDNSVQPEFVENTSGHYSISIKEIQEKNTKYTSKQVLLPFLRQCDWASLQIMCNHLPGWLEEEVLRRNISLQTEELGRNRLKVILKK